MVAAIVGGALIPLAEGHLADRIGVQHAFIIPAVCYVYIAIFGIIGSRRKDINQDQGTSLPPSNQPSDYGLGTKSLASGA